MGLWLRVVAAVVVLTSMALTATAVDAATVSISVERGALSVSAGNVVLIPDDSGSTARSVVGLSHWTATDARGDGRGWHLTISVGTIAADGYPVGSASTDYLLEIRLLDETTVSVAGSAQPASLVETMTTVPGTGSGSLRFLSARAHQGMGSYDLHPEFRLTTPAGSSATSYTATLTVDIAAGP